MSRSAIAAASPTTGAATAGITRQMILTVVRAARRVPEPTIDALDPGARSALVEIVTRACAVDARTGESLVHADVRPVESAGAADGAWIFGVLFTPEAGDGRQYRYCLVGVVAGSDGHRTLTGTSTLRVTYTGGSAPTTRRAALSGAVSVSVVTFDGDLFYDDVSFSAVGTSAKTTSTTTSEKKADPKTKAEKRAAKKKYAKRLKAAKRSYDKAVRKAGSDATAKAAAKNAYRQKKSSAKKKYKAAIADYRVVTRTRTTTDGRPFDIAAGAWV